jgi:hypothetical protein
MIPRQYTPDQREAMARRQRAAKRLEVARQVIRENHRYGYPVTQQHYEAVRAADIAYNRSTAYARSVAA